jgi:hypothetical protein
VHALIFEGAVEILFNACFHFTAGGLGGEAFLPMLQNATLSHVSL